MRGSKDSRIIRDTSPGSGEPPMKAFTSGSNGPITTPWGPSTVGGHQDKKLRPGILESFQSAQCARCAENILDKMNKSLGTLLLLLFYGYPIWLSAEIVILPVQLHGPNGMQVSKLALDLDNLNIDRNVIEFCEQHDIQHSYCKLLYDAAVVEVQKKLNSVAELNALPNQHLQRHPSTMEAEARRVFRSETLTFNDIERREDEVLEFLNQRWNMSNRGNTSAQSTSTTQGRGLPQRLCVIHSCTLGGFPGANSVLVGILNELAAAGLLDTFEIVLILNYGHAVSDIVKQQFVMYPNLEWIEVDSDTVYFEVPTLRILRRISVNLVAHHRLQLQQQQQQQQRKGVETGKQKVLPVGSSHRPQRHVHVLYLHTKGVSYTEVHQQIEDWKAMMLHFLVHNHESCFHLLESSEVDCIGTNFKSEPRRMFSGNFWWATAEHIAALPDLPYAVSGKYEAEVWLLGPLDSLQRHQLNRRKSIRIFVAHSTNINHAKDCYPRICYAPNSSEVRWLEVHASDPELFNLCGQAKTLSQTRKFIELI
jgi:hypothetical protein